jgi:diaminopimelate decarboxylase
MSATCSPHAGHQAPPGGIAVLHFGQFPGSVPKSSVRVVSAPAGALLTRVIYRKRGGHKNFIVVDAAMNDLIRPALYGAKHPVALVGPGRGPEKVYDIVGPVCESGDFLAEGARLREPANGQLLAVYSAGAYGFSMSSQYNSRPRAAEALIDGPSSWRLIRRRETYKDLVAAEL